MSTVFKHVKTIDFEPVIPLLSALTGFDWEAINNGSINYVLTSIEQKILTPNKHGSTTDNTTSSTPPEARRPTTPSSDSDGEAVPKCNGLCGAPACDFCGGTGGDQDCPAENDAGSGQIQSSASEIIQTGVGKLARDEGQRKRFRTEIEKSVVIPELLKDHLGFVHKLPSTLQLAALIGQKYLKSLQT